MDGMKAPIGYCPAKGCPNRSRGLCPEHARARSRESAAINGRSHPLLHTNRWKQTSKRRLALHPWCEGFPLGVHGSNRVLAFCTDHVKPVKDFPELCFDPTNHRSLCRDCNSRKGIAEEGGFGR